MTSYSDPDVDALAPVFHEVVDGGVAAWGGPMTVRGYEGLPAGAAGLRFSGW